jgi:hypothetical protein
MEFEKELSEELCEEYFQKMFGGIWKQEMLEKIIFPNGFRNTSAFLDFTKYKDESDGMKKITEVIFSLNISAIVFGKFLATTIQFFQRLIKQIFQLEAGVARAVLLQSLLKKKIRI